MKDEPEHRRIFQIFSTAAVVLFAMTIFAQAQSEQVTLIGEINDTFQLVADGKIYDVAQTPEGDDLVNNYISMKVKVIGVLQKGTEIDIVSVRAFEVVGE